MRFQVLMPASMKMTAFWDIELCSVIEVDWHFRSAYYIRHEDSEWPITWRQLSTSKIFVYFYDTIQFNIPERCHLQ
jgi:hypothetical protein